MLKAPMEQNQQTSWHPGRPRDTGVMAKVHRRSTEQKKTPQPLRFRPEGFVQRIGSRGLLRHDLKVAAIIVTFKRSATWGSLRKEPEDQQASRDKGH